jgi:hypothetical protein
LRLLLSDSLLIRFREFSGSFCHILGQSEIDFLLLAIDAVNLNLPLRNHAQILCNNPITPRTLTLQKFQHFFSTTLPMALAEGAQID